MQVDHLITTLRERTAFEAGDLGFSLVRHAGWAIWKPWLIATLPLFIVFNAVCWWAGELWIAGFLIWWLKPLFDRIPLFVLSRHLFGETPTTRATLHAQKTLWRQSALRALTWNRLDPARSFNMPIEQLEELRGRERRQRQKVLQKAVRSQAVWTTIGCAHLVMFFSFSVWGLLLFLIPVQYLPESAKALWTLFVQHDVAAAQVVTNLVAYLATTVVEPFYVGAGFALYLNRRAQIGAWDIELVFRRIGKRLRSAASLAAVVVLALMIVPVTPAHAKTEHVKPITVLPTSTLPADADTRINQAVKSAYQNPYLGSSKKVGHWVPRHPEDNAANLDGVPTWVRMLTAVLGLLSRWIIWILIACVLIALAIAIVRYRSKWLEPLRRLAKLPAPDNELSEHTIDAVTPLPPDIPAAARRLWQQNDPRGAMALLYRGAIQHSRTSGIAIPEDATESQCLRSARQLPESARTVFGATIRAWQYVAYAHEPPAASEFATLISRWAAAFGNASHE